jgi:hypothetical protein
MAASSKAAGSAGGGEDADAALGRRLGPALRLTHGIGLQEKMRMSIVQD